MPARTAEHRVRVPVLCASWWDLTFVHWRVEPRRIQSLPPRGLVVDECDGAAWVGLTPFRMTSIRPLGVPAPWGTAPRTPETNLRTYVRGPDGRDGIWFLSLDIGSSALAGLIRLAIGAPYHRARLRLEQRDGAVLSEGARRGGGPSYRLAVRTGAPVVRSDLEIWLTSRWRAYTHHFGRLLVTPVEHEPWPLQSACLEALEQDVTDAQGLPGLREPDLVHFSAGVDRVRIGVPTVLRNR